MNTNTTTREDILKVSRTIAQEQGFESINIRSVASACGVSVGSIYNYFDSKTELVSAVVESIWSDIFHHWEDAFIFQDTEVCVAWIYGRLNYGSTKYPGFFTHHSLSFLQEDKAEGKRLMFKTWQHILHALCSVIKRDAKVRPHAFTEQFTVEKFADILFSLILSAMLRSDYDSAPVLELVRRVLY